jgi:hypothetical protein
MMKSLEIIKNFSGTPFQIRFWKLESITRYPEPSKISSSATTPISVLILYISKAII